MGARHALATATWRAILCHMAAHDSVARTEAERIHALLGGAKAVPLRAPTMQRLHEASVQRLPVAVFDALLDSLLTSSDVLARVIALAPRTLVRRRKEGTLSAEESDRTLRLARVVARAEEVLGSREGALAWLREPNRGLGGAIPLDLVRTDAGTEVVTDVLGRIEHGVYG